MSGLLPFLLGFAAIATCWLPGRQWPSWILFSGALLLALGAHLTAIGLLIIAVLGLTIAAVRSDLGHPAVTRLIAFVLALPLFLSHSLHIPGFSRLVVIAPTRISPDAGPYSLTLHFGPLALGFFYSRLLITRPTLGDIKMLYRLENLSTRQSRTPERQALKESSTRGGGLPVVSDDHRRILGLGCAYDAQVSPSNQGSQECNPTGSLDIRPRRKRRVASGRAHPAFAAGFE